MTSLVQVTYSYIILVEQIVWGHQNITSLYECTEEVYMQFVSIVCQIKKIFKYYYYFLYSP